jgi:uncharacterized protein YdaU (DUF1376 family)
MSKSPAFQWYAADYLADERVTQLSLESEAAYVRLLNYCWREGSIPAKAEQCAPMCKYADVKVIKPALALFMKSATQPGRLVHKRLEEERAKQEEYRARQAAKGAKGGRPRKEDEKPEKAAALPGLNNGLAGVKPDESSLSSTSSSIPSNDGSAGRPSPSADLQARLDALTDTSGELLWSESLLTKPAYFATVLEKLKLPADLDSEHYRLDALLKAEAKQVSRTISGWESWVANYFTNQKARGPLLTIDATLPTKPTPKNELPPPGKERKGQVLAFAGENDDYVNRTRQGNYQRHWPGAIIHIIQPRA